MKDEIDVDALLAGMTPDELRAACKQSIADVGRLMDAVRAKARMMSKGEGAVDAAIDLLERCRCC